ncbi:MAG: SRPBCC family protein [Devosia sp.]
MDGGNRNTALEKRQIIAQPRKRTDRASRFINATPDKVYSALVDPEALVSWLPPRGMTARIEAYDLRPGGSYRMILTYKDVAGARPKSSDNSDVVEGRFVDLVPRERLVQAVEFDSDDPAFAGTMIMTWRLEAAGEGTQVTIVADNVPEGISAEDHDAGLRSSLENLADYAG